ncbi:MAG: hypothetical protein H6729_14290 [Deltaproteobacteria bacterium]|nr:hypothetical protein [Deltaproteobacteria bacterium]
MKCVSDQELRRFLLEDLDPDRAAAVRNHLSRCVECGLAHEEMTLMLSRLRADGDEFDDPTLTRDVMRLIRIGAETIGAQAAREQPNAMVIGGTKIDTMTAAGAESWAQTLRLLWRKKASSTFAVSAAAALAAIVAISGVSAVFAVLVLAPKTHHDDEAFQTRGSTASANRWVSIRIFRKLEPRTFVPTSDVLSPQTMR